MVGNAREAYLAIVDRREGRAWSEKVFNEIRPHEGFNIQISFPSSLAHFIAA